MSLAFSAEDVYGAGPVRGQGPNGARPKMATQGRVTTPAAAGSASASQVRVLTDDPVFWLVAMVGTVAFLAQWAGA